MKTSVANALNAFKEREQAVKEAEAAFQRQLAGQTQELLRAHAADSKRLSRDALKQTARSLADLQAVVSEQCQATSKQIRRLLHWPVVTTAITCLALLLASGLISWVMLKSARMEVAKAEAQAQETRRQIAALEAQFCASPAGRRFCQPNPTK